MQSEEHRTPYRIVVFASGFGPGRLHKRYTEIVKPDHAYMGWTPQQHYQEARLPSAGSFLYPGFIAVRRAAMEYLALPETRQVSIKNKPGSPGLQIFQAP